MNPQTMSPATRAALELQAISPNRLRRADDLPIPTMRAHRMSLDNNRDSHDSSHNPAMSSKFSHENRHFVQKSSKKMGNNPNEPIRPIDFTLHANRKRNVCCQTDEVQEIVHVETTKYTVSKFRWVMFFLSIPSCVATIILAIILCSMYYQTSFFPLSNKRLYF
eukprot:GDKJ01018085.1.p1 GENE.GDKJ01018085.1~~GDKJ01018085.1.p1  ORF type:complete len:164 (-),score=12.81 GDKJ01018085.1:28-519(-)